MSTYNFLHWQNKKSLLQGILVGLNIYFKNVYSHEISGHEMSTYCAKMSTPKMPFTNDVTFLTLFG